MSRRSMVLATLSLALSVLACTTQEQERLGSIPAQSKAKAEQVEVQQLLQQVFAMQAAFYAANGQYSAHLDEIGVRIPAQARYHYTLTSAGSTWRCQATANLDTDPTVDTWLVDQNGGVRCVSDDASS